jgi:hypothetical protein
MKPKFVMGYKLDWNFERVLRDSGRYTVILDQLKI